MDCTFANGVNVNDVIVCKLVTGELAVGRVDVTEELVRDVALIVPKEVKQDEETKFGFYVIPYGFPMVQKVTGETLSLISVVKVFTPTNGFEDVVSMYLKIIQREIGEGQKNE
jgi:hypothetical protein